MKKFLLSLGLVTAICSGAMAEKYTGPTTPMPDNVVWDPVTAAPGVYKELVGQYRCDLSQAYIYMYSNNLFSYPKAWVVDENDEIVYTGSVRPYGLGTRNGNIFYMDIPADAAITSPGTYYMIFPAAQSPDKTGQVMEISTGEIADIYNLKAGPYIVGDVGEPVDAQISVEPTGIFVQPEGISYFTLTIGNASILNASNLDNDMDEYGPTITVKGPDGEVTMEPGVKTDNVIKWEFPLDENAENSAILPGGEYSVTINYETFSGFTADFNPITFPSSPVTYNFTIEGGATRGVTPEITLSPTNSEFETWTASTIGITIKGYKFAGTAGELSANIPVLIVVDPDGETYEPVGRARSLNAIAYTVSDIDFSKPGTYNCYWKIAGRAGINTSDLSEVVFNDVEFAYVNITKPALPIVTPDVEQTNPTPVADAFKSTILTLKMTDYTIDDLSSTHVPDLVITKPSGESVTTQTMRVIGTQYQYKVDPNDFTEAGTYTILWKLAGWTGKTVTTDGGDSEAVEFADVTLTYLIGNPTEPEEPENTGAEVEPTPGTYKEMEGLVLTFGQDFISNFGGWLGDFNATATVTPEGGTEAIEYDPEVEDGGMTVTYGINLTNTERTTYKIAINLWRQKYYVATAARALETDYVPADKSWIVLNYTIDKSVGIEGIEADEERAGIYFDLNGVRLKEKPEHGAYIHVTGRKAIKSLN